ncbi:MAG: ATP-grasp domain-containing protein [Candidatus Peribacteria bacterium]|nr:ATP-grasp domain-containing protein [Candidatus Peribacteria bacterium]
MVKPNTGGSSVGVHFITAPEELSEVLEEIFQIDEEALIEETISGTEISVPIIDGEVYPAIKIKPLLGEFFDYQSKYTQGGSRETIYEYPNEDLKAEIEAFTKMTYYALKCKGAARVDMMIRDAQAYVLEINTLPGMTATSLLPKSLLSQGKNYAEVVELLINSSIKRLEILVEASIEE